MAEEAKDRTVENFKDELLHKLNELRETNILCDAIIRAQGEDFPAHKCVLSAASPYFRAMFTSELKEKESNHVELQEIKSATLIDVLRYVYTGGTRIDSSNAKDLVMATDYLIIPSLKARATLFLEGTWNGSCCLALESFASRYNCEALKKAAVAYKMENFVDVTRSEDFRLLDVEKVKELICMDEINVAEEEEVYEALMSWVKYDLPSREYLLPELLKRVRLFSIPKYGLRKILDDELISKDPICMKEVITALDLSLFPGHFQEAFKKPRLPLSKYEQVVILTGGEDGEGSNDKTQCFVLSDSKWLSLPSMPFPRSHHGAAVCGGLLYVMGGDKSAPVCYFNPKQNKWSTLNVTMDKKGCSVTSFNQELYVIGGEGSWHDVHIYYPLVNEWRQVTSMETARAGHSAVVLQQKIYVIAGHDGRACKNSVECYNPSIDKWVRAPKLSKVRRSAAASTVVEKIIVVGGFGDMTTQTIQLSYEVYDSCTNQWSLVPTCNFPRAACSSVSIGDEVHLFGGEDERIYKSEVMSLDITSRKWYTKAFMDTPRQCSFLQASLLKLPKDVIYSLAKD
ncbi:kelch-like protein 3 [Stylophora pistillata]|uniref:kelch-like protein 3 n=1 Tax=Stylophora pistillata TaxID=50429 RepID=UPI000C0462F8|nr:kelch-like protein 3 [Stylophora pistillata]